MTIIRCVACGLRQYAVSSICRRCHADLGISIIEIPLRGKPADSLGSQKLPDIPIV
jgi:uncharacterized OB-fold protein